MFSSNTSAVSGDAVFVEDVFSAYLYTGNGSTQTITNGIDLAGKGGMVWLKYRSGSAGSIYHHVYDSARGKSGNTSYNYLYPNVTDPQGTGAYGPTSFNADGFSLNSYLNESSIPYVGWTFRKQPKFFDVVTYTGNGANRTISHNLGSTPGCMIVKNLTTAGDWKVYHRSLTSAAYVLYLNGTNAQTSRSTTWNSTAPTSTVFSVGTDADVNNSGDSYVAYIFAHDAGGFGLTGTDNVISCGSYTGTGAAGNTINLGYEPQWVLIKNSTAGSYPNWFMFDNMRGMPVGSGDPYLYANSSQAEAGGAAQYIAPTATGFQMMASNVINESGQTYIYIAIRRGPMKVPTDATKVFDPIAYSGTGTDNRIITSSVTPDSVIPAYRNTTGAKYWYDRLRGNGTYLITSGTNAEGTDGSINGPQFNKVQTGYQQGTSDSGFLNFGSYTYVNYLLRRAPGFFDVVCYTGTNTAQTLTHNLGAAPEFIICKDRTAPDAWYCYSATIGNTKYIRLDSTAAASSAGSQWWNNTSPTSTTFTAGTAVSTSPDNYVAYLFATCPGVSKVGSYTGNGSSQTINCGFAAGARFVLIKRTDSTGDWYVWDTARGIVSGNDPHLSLNSTAAEVTTDDTIDPDSSGFIVNQLSATNVNVNAATYIFLAIA